MLSSLTSTLSGFVERLSPRERVLLSVMAFVALAMVCFLIVLLTNRSITALEEEVDENHMLLSQFRQSAPGIQARLQKAKQPVRGSAADAPDLGTQLEAHATKTGMGTTDLEMTPQPPERIGNWMRKSVQVRMRRKPLGELANFWALTASDRARYPVAITRLDIRRRRHEEDSFDVEMVVSSYTPAEEPEPSKNGRGRSKTSSKRSSKRP